MDRSELAMKILTKELQTFNGTEDWILEHGEGYRIVYIYENGKYYIGAYCKTIE